MAEVDPSALQSEAEAVLVRWQARRAAGEHVALEDLCGGRADLVAAAQRIESELRDLDVVERRVEIGAPVDPDVPHAPRSNLRPWDREWSARSTREALQRLATHSSAGGRYQRRQQIAVGGMGRVLEVWDEELRRPLAMKMIREDLIDDIGDEERLLQRFLEEAQITAQLAHPGIVPVHEVGLDSRGRVYFTMPVVVGSDLSEVFDKARSGKDGWTTSRAVGLLVRVCETIGFAHAKGVVHRDLKPANVRIGKYGEVYVMDWGLARALGSAPDPRGDAAVSTTRRDEIRTDSDSPMATMPRRHVGTVYYMSREQAEGEEPTTSFDVHAIGAMLYELLVGKPPYRTANGACDPAAERAAARDALLAGAPTPIEALVDSAPTELVAICERAMQRDPELRYASALDLAEDLQAWLDGRVVRAHATGPWAELRKWVGRNRKVAATALGALLLLLAAGGVFLLVLSNRQVEITEANAKLSTANAEIVAKSLAQARGRGNWAAVLDVLDRGGSSIVDPVEAVLLRAQALSNLQHYEEARVVLEPLTGRDDLGQHTGRALYLLGEVEMYLTGWTPEVETLLRSAREQPLAESESALIDGLLAETMPEAAERLGRALELDPYLHDARVQRAFILTWLERRDEVRRELDLLATLHPESLSAGAAALAIGALMGLPDAEARAREHMANHPDEVNGRELELALEIAGIARRASAAGFLGAVVPQEVLLDVKSMGSLRSLSRDSGVALRLTHPLMRRVSEAISEFTSQTSTDGKRLESLHAVAPNSLTLWFLAARSLDSAVAAGRAEPTRMRAALEHCASLFDECARTALLIPGMGRAARNRATLANALLGKKTATGEDPARMSLAHQGALWILAQDDATLEELEAWRWPFGEIGDSALTAVLESRITTLREARERAKAANRSAQVEALLVDLRKSMGEEKLLVARSLATRILKRDPENAEAKQALERIAQLRGEGTAK